MDDTEVHPGDVAIPGASHQRGRILAAQVEHRDEPLGCLHRGRALAGNEVAHVLAGDVAQSGDVTYGEIAPLAGRMEERADIGGRRPGSHHYLLR